MSDSLPSFTASQASVNTGADRFLLQYERVQACVAPLQQFGYSAGLSEQINKELGGIRVALVSHEGGQLLASELINANKFVAVKSDRRNVEVLLYGLQCLADYLDGLRGNAQENASVLLPVLNELAAMMQRPLITESVFSVPETYCVSSQLLSAANDSVDRESQYLEFSQLLHSIQRGEDRLNKTTKLTELFNRLADRTDNNKAQSFWLACGVFMHTVEYPDGELRPAVHAILKQIEKVVIDALGGGKRPVLGIQATLDKLLCNLLCYVHCSAYQGEHLKSLQTTFGFTTVLAELDQLKDSVEAHNSDWIKHSASALLVELRQSMQLLADGNHEPVDEYTKQVLSLRQSLIVAGVHGAGDNLQEVAEYLEEDATADVLHSAAVSFELVEQQMMYQYDLVASDKSNTEADDSELNAKTDSKDNELSSDYRHVDVDFVVRCNSCIDVIQHALDTALGSSGNLIPDNSVVSALNKLNNIIAEENIQPLDDLLTPLSRFLKDAEDSTLNQSETLLVQEAIIAATLGIDSLVSDNPMPALISDVTARIKTAEDNNNYRYENNDLQNSSLGSFLSEASELQPRLFELFQRWRGAPEGANRLSAEINRLLHTLKEGAEDAGQVPVASLTHYLESTMVDCSNSTGRPSQAFFDLAIESIESLGDDIIQLRNNEALDKHSDLIDRLKLAGAIDNGADVEINKTSQAHAEWAAAEQNPLELTSAEITPAQQTGTEAAFQDTKAGSEATGNSFTHNSAEHKQAEQQPVEYKPVGWQKSFNKIDDCYQQINHQHVQLLRLQQKLESTIQQFTHQENLSVPSDLQIVVDDLRQTTDRQGASIKQLDEDLNSTSQIASDALHAALSSSVAQTADEAGVQVDFQFSNQITSLDRSLILQLQLAIEPLLESIVRYTLEDASERTVGDKQECATIEVSITALQSGLFIEVVDDGAGVVMQGAMQDLKNPWSQASKAKIFQSASAQQQAQSLLVHSSLSDQLIQIDPLVELASRYGGTVAIVSDQQGSQYRISVPYQTAAQDVLLFESGTQRFAIAASKVAKVALWAGEQALSVAQLLGNFVSSTQSSFDTKENYTAVHCRAADGPHTLLVDRVLGHQSIKVTHNERVIPETVSGFSGAFVDETGEVVLVLDVDYWLALAH